MSITSELPPGEIIASAPLFVTLFTDEEEGGWLVMVRSKGSILSVAGKRTIAGSKLQCGCGDDPIAALVDLYAQTESNDEFAEFNGQFTIDLQSQQSLPILGVDPPEIDLRLDGDMWCAKIGPNLQVGIAGFGAHPIAAVVELFDTLSARPDLPAVLASLI